MPFQSDKQKRWMYANEPEIAREWSDRYGAMNGGIINSRKGYAFGDERVNQNQPSTERELQAAYQQIMAKFMERFPNIDTDNMRIEDMIAMLQVEGVLDTEGGGISSMKEGMDMINPESVDRSTQRISMGDTQWGDIPEEVFTSYNEYNKGGRVGVKHGGQLVKRGPGRPGYGGPHETYDTGKSYEAATSPGGGGGDNWQRQALKDFSKISPSKPKKDITDYINPKNIQKATTAYNLFKNLKGGNLPAAALSYLGPKVLNKILNRRNPEEIDEVGGITNLNLSPHTFNPNYNFNPNEDAAYDKEQMRQDIMDSLNMDNIQDSVIDSLDLSGINSVPNNLMATGPQGILPGLEPINTMNNPTWNNATNQFEWGMGNPDNFRPT